jgi:hypothetical protein
MQKEWKNLFLLMHSFALITNHNCFPITKKSYFLKKKCIDTARFLWIG